MTSTRPAPSGSTFAKLSHQKARSKSKPAPAVTDPARRSNLLVAMFLGLVLVLGAILILRGLA